MDTLNLEALILDGHSRAAVECTQSLGRAGIAVAVSSELPDAIAFESRYARMKLVQPAVMPAEGFLEWLRQLDAIHRFRLIIPSTENSLLALLELPEQDSLRIRAVLPSNRALQVALDKNRTLELAARLQVPGPSTRVITNSSEAGVAASFPVVLKPASSKVSDGEKVWSFEPAIVHDEPTRQTLLDSWLPRVAVLEQEYVQGWGVGIEMLYQGGRLVWYLAHERLHEWPLTGGASTYRKAIEPPPGMLEAAVRLFDELQWNGVGMVEFKLRKDGSYALMEINPRLWGSLALSIDAGVDFPVGLWKVATGQALPPQPDYRRGMRTRNMKLDLRWIAANLRADRANPSLLLRPRVISLLELGLVLLNRERWDHFQWTDPKPAFGTLWKAARGLARSVRRRLQVRTMLRRRNTIVQRSAEHLASIKASRQPVVLFVCLGNICRSAFAELAAREYLSGCRIESAGFDRRAGRETPATVVDAATRAGFPMAGWRSKTLTEQHVRQADLIFVMDLDQFDRIGALDPDCRARVVLLGLFADIPTVAIEDPDRKDGATADRVIEQIVSAVHVLAACTKARSASKLNQLTGEPAT